MAPTNREREPKNLSLPSDVREQLEKKKNQSEYVELLVRKEMRAVEFQKLVVEAAVLIHNDHDEVDLTFSMRDAVDMLTRLTCLTEWDVSNNSEFKSALRAVTTGDPSDGDNRFLNSRGGAPSKLAGLPKKDIKAFIQMLEDTFGDEPEVKNARYKLLDRYLMDDFEADITLSRQPLVGFHEIRPEGSENDEQNGISGFVDNE